MKRNRILLILSLFSMIQVYAYDFATENIKRVYSNGNVVTLYDPYTKGMINPLTGQIHVHTTNSDGAHAPAKVATIMKDAGIDFWTITDHNYITQNPNVNDLIWLCNAYEDTRNTQHTNIFKAQSVYNSADINQIIDHFIGDGSIVMLNHPDWTGLYLSNAMITGIKEGLSFVEVFNSAGTTFSDRGFDLLLSNGQYVWGTATDDFHNDSHLKTGWVVAFSTSRNPNDILSALLAGSFVASSGFMITDVRLVDNVITINTGNSEATTTFYKENMTVLATKTGEMAEYAIKGDEKFVRAVVQGAAEKKCWVQPYFILGSEPTSIPPVEDEVFVSITPEGLKINGCDPSDTVTIYTVYGQLVYRSVVGDGVISHSFPKGVYIIHTARKSLKIVY